MNYVIVTQDGKPEIQSVPCVVCDGKGAVAPPPVDKPPPGATEAELWPILVPLVIFFLFFAFLWV